LFYDVTGEHPPKHVIPHELQITFAMGHAIHDKIQRALHFAFKGRFADEVKVDLYEAFVAGSSADGVLDLGHTRVLVEVKSIGKEFDKLQAPKTAHLVQAAGIYATALDTPFISYLYVSKAWPHSIKEFVIPYDPMVYKKWWRSKGSKVEDALESGEPPIADSDKYECTSCPYNYFCPQKLNVTRGMR
jgi:CRISPR/Cas system-associated exonuclease Cas4 (RecB family)